MSQNPNTDSKEEEAAKDKVTEKKKSYTDNQLLRMMINEQKDAKKLLTKINANLSFFCVDVYNILNTIVYCFCDD